MAKECLKTISDYVKSNQSLLPKSFGRKNMSLKHIGELSGMISVKIKNYINNHIKCNADYKENKSALAKISMKESPNLLAKAASKVLEKKEKVIKKH